MTTAMTDSPWRISLDTPTTERHTAHQQRPAEVTIYYRYHPLRTQNLPVVRLYDFHDEVYYVVRRADGTPLAVPIAAYQAPPFRKMGGTLAKVSTLLIKVGLP